MKITLSSIIFLFSFTVLGHGENMLGPHGGVIRMPGAFHTEVVLDNKKAKIYLLDIAFKNPITIDSNVSVFLISSGNSDKEVTCSAVDEYFECKLPYDWKNYNSLKVLTKRNGSKGKEVIYPLPLIIKNK